jgi:hypothetical protein
MDHGERTTGTRDEHYNLISVLYHALHGAENCEMYVLDAEASGRMDLYEFFAEAQGVQVGLAERAKELLGIGASVAPGASGVPSGAVRPETDVPVDFPPPSEDVTPGEERTPRP